MGLFIETIVVMSIAVAGCKVFGDKVCGYRRKWPWEK